MSGLPAGARRSARLRFVRRSVSVRTPARSLCSSSADGPPRARPRTAGADARSRPSPLASILARKVTGVVAYWDRERALATATSHRRQAPGTRSRSRIPGHCRRAAPFAGARAVDEEQAHSSRYRAHALPTAERHRAGGRAGSSRRIPKTPNSCRRTVGRASGARSGQALRRTAPTRTNRRASQPGSLAEGRALVTRVAFRAWPARATDPCLWATASPPAVPHSRCGRHRLGLGRLRRRCRGGGGCSRCCACRC